MEDLEYEHLLHTSKLEISGKNFERPNSVKYWMRQTVEKTGVLHLNPTFQKNTDITDHN